MSAVYNRWTTNMCFPSALQWCSSKPGGKIIDVVQKDIGKWMGIHLGFGQHNETTH